MQQWSSAGTHAHWAWPGVARGARKRADDGLSRLSYTHVTVCKTAMFVCQHARYIAKAQGLHGKRMYRWHAMITATHGRIGGWHATDASVCKSIEASGRCQDTPHAYNRSLGHCTRG
jgi:hypothetical protein